MPYGGFAERVGKYRSRLEREWARFFSGKGRIPGRYVGDEFTHHDFELWPGTPDELWVEVKPDDNKVWYQNEFVYTAAARLMVKFEDDLRHTPERTKRDALILAGWWRTWLYLSWTPEYRSIVEFEGPVVFKKTELTEIGRAKVEEAKKRDAAATKKHEISDEIIAKMDASLWVTTKTYDLLTPIRELRAGTYKHESYERKFEIDETYFWTAVAKS